MKTNIHEWYIQFMGGAGTVTGSKFLIASHNYKLLVDCGLFQGLKNLRELNWMELPVPAREIDAVLLTHGHLDHIGYLPRLVNQGFKGTIHCSHPTEDLAEIILSDSAKIQEEDAEHANKMGYSKHSPALPLYTLRDVEKTLGLIKPKPLNEFFSLTDNIQFRFRRNAHIPGSAFIELDVGRKRFVFSGDLGRPGDPMLHPPDKPEMADILIIESTYGDRLHPSESTEDVLLKIIHKSLQNHGPLIVPSFTVDRAQDFMYVLWKLKQAKKIPDIPVYLDSPMGTDVSKLFLKYPEWLNIEAPVFREVFKSTRMVRTVEETRHLARNKHPRIIIAGSGMMNGGRILEYLESHLEDPSATIIIPGYQAAGTRGRLIDEGAPEIKIRGQYFKVKANIESIHTMSSHADQGELLDWMSTIQNTPEKVFVVHGEPQASHALRVKIQDRFNWECNVPDLLQRFEVKFE